ncbi:MAG TPA: DUF481 domain-containing protein [Acidobacteriaceae bacterium]|jgi:hypothetical protein|nr:DUF481 domain-containing protein [Acidobacteriaceae bacterium]
MCRYPHLSRSAVALSLLLLAPSVLLRCAAQDKPGASPDTLVLSNGDTLHGKLVKETDGTLTFHSDSLGDVTVSWDKIKELHATGDFAVLDKTVKHRGKKSDRRLPTGPIDATSESVTVHPAAQQEAPPPIATKNAEYIVDKATLDKQLYHEPGFFTGWNGAATAGATLVSATQNQYTVSGSVGLIRTVPTMTWLDTRNRTSADFSGSFGKITQPGYTTPTGPVAATSTKSSILHLDAERDEYFAPRFFGLAQTAFDHNFSQDLNLQQIYGGGAGWTALKTPKQLADLKATLQYEKQSFISGSGSTNQNLIGSTLAADYSVKLKLLAFTQTVGFIPAFNSPHDYSAQETDTVTFPTYKSFGFSVGTLDSYLNDPPATLPPTKRNSFQFTMGLTYAIKSRY